MKQAVRFRVDFSPACSLGPGKIELLEGIARTGSLRQAAQLLDMSYRRAWLLVDALNHSFSEPATTSSVGGHGGGGVTLTPLGEEIVRCYRAASAAIESVARSQFQSIATKALTQAPKSAAPRRKRVTRRKVTDRRTA